MQIDWPGIRAAAVALGVREALRQAAKDLSPYEQNRFVERGLKRCSREKWLVREERMTPAREKGEGRNVPNGAYCLANYLAERKNHTKIHLSEYVVNAPKRAARSHG